MWKFLILSAGSALLLFFGVLLGMQQANNSMEEMRGYDDPEMKEVISVEEGEDGVVEASVLGKEVDATQIEEKKEKLQHIKSFNFFSELGKKLSEILETLFTKIIEISIFAFEKIIEKIPI
ncbi:DUF3679 domain-containing protein [Bacillus tianshenii]|nr:DUF3679 domain-containing protein [Bacillus tianshenii]